MLLRHVAVTLVFVLAGCIRVKSSLETLRERQSATTFAKFLRLAEAGDAKSQNLVGFMLYFGELVPKDRYAARRWFHRAADQGNSNAQLNLAVLHYLGEGGLKNLDEAERYFRLAQTNAALSLELDVPESLAALAQRAAMRAPDHEGAGESTYATFCAGCHGLNGIAVYYGAPSFALAERMGKSDAELLRTITEGHGVMPTWSDKLPAQALVDALSFVRTLPAQYQNGIAQVLRTPPSRYFFFGPMSADPGGFYQDYLY